MLLYFSFNVTSPTPIYTLSLHDALPISARLNRRGGRMFSTLRDWAPIAGGIMLLAFLGFGDRQTDILAHVFGLPVARSEEHTSELQSRSDLVCRLLLEKKNYVHKLTSPI